MSEEYLLDNSVAAAGDRFAAMARLFDPVTLRHVDALGIGPGSRIWEVGAGGAALPRALAAKVTPDGEVLATDIDVSWLAEGDGYRVQVHDVAADTPPAGPFDLIHARLVLVHLPAREKALAAMLSVLRPGGWLLIEDADPALQPLLCPDEAGPAEELGNRLRRGFRELMTARGADLAFGRSLPRLLRNNGLQDVGADAYFPIASVDCALLETATIAHIRSALVSQALATDREIDEHLANVATGTMDLTTAPLISAWGRRPQ